MKSTVSRKRESMELFETSKNLHGDDKDSSVSKILKERSTIAASMRSINDVIRYASKRLPSLWPFSFCLLISHNGFAFFFFTLISQFLFHVSLSYKHSLPSYLKKLENIVSIKTLHRYQQISEKYIYLQNDKKYLVTLILVLYHFMS